MDQLSNAQTHAINMRYNLALSGVMNSCDILEERCSCMVACPHALGIIA